MSVIPTFAVPVGSLAKGLRFARHFATDQITICHRSGDRRVVTGMDIAQNPDAIGIVAFELQDGWNTL